MARVVIDISYHLQAGTHRHHKKINMHRGWLSSILEFAQKRSYLFPVTIPTPRVFQVLHCALTLCYVYTSRPRD